MVTRPDEPLVIVNHLGVCVEHGFFEVFEVVFLESKLPLQCSVRHTPLSL